MNTAFLLLSVLSACLAFMTGYFCRGYLDLKTNGASEPKIHMVATAAKETDAGESFPVARTDRRPTWRQRRKQLEAAARKERERIEAWRG